MKNSMMLFFDMLFNFDEKIVNQFFLKNRVKKIMTLLFFGIVWNKGMQNFDIVSKNASS